MAHKWEKMNMPHPDAVLECCWNGGCGATKEWIKGITEYSNKKANIKLKKE